MDRYDLAALAHRNQCRRSLRVDSTTNFALLLADRLYPSSIQHRVPSCEGKGIADKGKHAHDGNDRYGILALMVCLLYNDQHRNFDTCLVDPFVQCDKLLIAVLTLVVLLALRLVSIRADRLPPVLVYKFEVFRNCIYSCVFRKRLLQLSHHWWKCNTRVQSPRIDPSLSIFRTGFCRIRRV